MIGNKLTYFENASIIRCGKLNGQIWITIACPSGKSWDKYVSSHANSLHSWQRQKQLCTHNNNSSTSSNSNRLVSFLYPILNKGLIVFILRTYENLPLCQFEQNSIYVKLWRFFFVKLLNIIFNGYNLKFLLIWHFQNIVFFFKSTIWHLEKTTLAKVTMEQGFWKIVKIVEFCFFKKLLNFGIIQKFM